MFIWSCAGLYVWPIVLMPSSGGLFHAFYHEQAFFESMLSYFDQADKAKPRLRIFRDLVDLRTATRDVELMCLLCLAYVYSKIGASASSDEPRYGA